MADQLREEVQKMPLQGCVVAQQLLLGMKQRPVAGTAPGQSVKDGRQGLHFSVMAEELMAGKPGGEPAGGSGQPAAVVVQDAADFGAERGQGLVTEPLPVAAQEVVVKEVQKRSGIAAPGRAEAVPPQQLPGVVVGKGVDAAVQDDAPVQGRVPAFQLPQCVFTLDEISQQAAQGQARIPPCKQEVGEMVHASGSRFC